MNEKGKTINLQMPQYFRQFLFMYPLYFGSVHTDLANVEQLEKASEHRQSRIRHINKDIIIKTWSEFLL